MKLCSVCQEPTVEFATRSSRCKPCHREYTRQHYRDNKQYYVDKAKRNKGSQIDRVRVEVLSRFEVGCADCGTTDLRVLEFDHLSDKEFNIAEAMSGSIGFDRVVKEINKCEVVCANHHKIRTVMRADNWRNQAFVYPLATNELKG